MKISELITRLELIKKEHGDVEVTAWCRGDGGAFDFDVTAWCRGDGGAFDFDVDYENGETEVFLMDNTDYD